MVQAKVVMEVAPEATMQQLREFLAFLNLKFSSTSFCVEDLMMICRKLMQNQFADAKISLVSSNCQQAKWL